MAASSGPFALASPCFIGPESHAVCVNTGSGGHDCLNCPPGYEGDGHTCTDIDEVHTSV